jgi:zinc protease
MADCQEKEKSIAMSIRRMFIVSYAVLAWVVIPQHCPSAGSAEPAATPKLTIETYVLANGLKVALSRDPAAPRTTVSIAYHVGSKNERPGLTGFAHFFEHMMFRGTRNVPNFDQPLQEAGGASNAFTSEDMTVYFETIPNNYVQRALYLEAERMAFLSSALNQEKFDTEREVVKNERRQAMENVPYGLADETLSFYVFPKGHPYSWSVIGSMRDLNRSTLEDLRQFFLEFYHPANATLTMVGGFASEEAKRWIEIYFGPLAAGPALATLDLPPAAPIAQRVVQKDRVQFPRVYWAWPTVAETHPDAPALDLLAMLLSDGDASRLMQALVMNAQVAVDVSASGDAREVGGLFQVVATAAPTHKVDELETLISQELKRMQATAPASDELARVKAKHRTSLLAGLTSPMRRNILIATGLAQHNDPHHYQTLFTRYEQVTPQDVQRVAREYLSDDKVVLVVEPVAEGEKESEAVQGGPLPGEAPRAIIAAREPAGGPDWTVMPPPTARGTFVTPPFQRHKLRNGLEVWVSPWHTLPLVSTRLLIATGSADDPAGSAGLAQLTSTLWDQGTTQLTSTALAEAIDALGTSLDVSSDTDTTELSFTVESGSLADALQLVGQMIVQPRFDDTDFQRERQLQLSELTSGPDSVSWIAQRVFPKLLYGEKHPLASPGPGYTRTVESLTRGQVQTFYRDHFTPQRGVLIVVGDVETTALLEMLESQFARWQGAAAAAVQLPPAPAGAAAETVFLVDKPAAVQSVIIVGRTWRDRIDDSYFATRIGNRVLGGDFLSRLNQNLRERNGYTYGARSDFDYQRASSRWTLRTSVRREVTGAALREIVSELDAVSGDRPLTEDEVVTARDAELSSFPEAFETPSHIAGSLAQLAIFHLPDNYYEQHVTRLAATNPEEVAKAMSQLTDRRSVMMLVVGDRQVVEPKLKEAGFERIRYVDSDGQPVRAVRDVNAGGR